MKYFIALLFFHVCVLNGCIKMPVYMSKNVLFNKQGHRGCRGLMPENTFSKILLTKE